MRRTCSHEARECCPSPGQQTFSLSVLEPCTHPRALPEKAGKITQPSAPKYDNSWPTTIPRAHRTLYSPAMEERPLNLVSIIKELRTQGPYLHPWLPSYHTHLIYSPTFKSRKKKLERRKELWEGGQESPSLLPKFIYSSSELTGLCRSWTTIHGPRTTTPITAPEQLHLVTMNRKHPELMIMVSVKHVWVFQQ